MKNMKAPAAALLVKSLIELDEWSTIGEIAKHSGSTVGRTQGAKLTLLRLHGKWKGKHTLMAKKTGGITRFKIVKIDKHSSPKLRAHQIACRKPDVTIAGLVKMAGCCTDMATEVRDSASEMGLLHEHSSPQSKRVGCARFSKPELAAFAAAKMAREIWPNKTLNGSV